MKTKLKIAYEIKIGAVVFKEMFKEYEDYGDDLKSALEEEFNNITDDLEKVLGKYAIPGLTFDIEIKSRM